MLSTDVATIAGKNLSSCRETEAHDGVVNEARAHIGTRVRRTSGGYR